MADNGAAEAWLRLTLSKVTIKSQSDSAQLMGNTVGKIEKTHKKTT
jgi:hypothetical protein